MFLLAATTTVTPVATDASGSTSLLDPVVATAYGPAVPWMLLILIVVLAALVVVAIRLTRHWRTRQQVREDARVQEAVKQALGGKEVPSPSES